MSVGGRMAPKLTANMSLDQQITGTRRAIKSLRSRRGGPIWLVPSLSKPLRKLVAECRKAAVTSVRNAGPVIEHIEREHHPEAFEGARECKELELQNSLALRRLV
jgi:hypothetical protein